jgi:hypothetical protein
MRRIDPFAEQVHLGSWVSGFRRRFRRMRLLDLELHGRVLLDAQFRGRPRAGERRCGRPASTSRPPSTGSELIAADPPQCEQSFYIRP